MANIHKYPYRLYFQAIQAVPYWRFLGLLLLKYPKRDWKTTVKSVCMHARTHTYTLVRWFRIFRISGSAWNSKPRSVKNLSKL